MDFRLVQTTNNQEFFAEVDFNVAELKIDPDYWLVSKTSKIVGVQSKVQINKMAVFPNPFTENISIKLPANEKMVSLQLFNAEGQCLKQFYGDKTDFNMADIANGIYVLHIVTNLETFTQTIIKQ
jgi:hypothetical protein